MNYRCIWQRLQSIIKDCTRDEGLTSSEMFFDVCLKFAVFALKSFVCVILHVSTYILSWKEGKEIGKKMKIPEGMLPKHKQPLPPSVVA